MAAVKYLSKLLLSIRMLKNCKFNQRVGMIEILQPTII